MAEIRTTLSRPEAPGMIALKADLAAAEVAEAVGAATGCAVPEVRRIVASGASRIAWMAPDELLLIVPHDAQEAAFSRLSEALPPAHRLVADVSDMRALFRIAGPGARETLAKLCPVDLAPDSFGPGEIRRTRLAQIPAAFWLEGDAFTLLCFRSVAAYAEQVLSDAARPGGEVGLFA